MARWVDSALDDADKALLEAAWESEYSARTIFKWLRSKGADNFTEQTVWRHRTGDCACRPRRVEVKAA